MMKRVIFCANHVTLSIAVCLAQRDREIGNSVIFYMANRCDFLAYKDSGVSLIRYSRVNFLLFALKNIFSIPDEFCVPHMRGGRLIKLYAKLVRTLSAIDDGMDTLRDSPKNINLNDFKSGSNYYTFNYSFALPSWLNHFSIEKVCDIKCLSISSRPQALIHGVNSIIVESTGVENSTLLTQNIGEDVLLVKHSNKNKNTIKHICAKSVSGKNISLEKTIEVFQGNLIVGESMVAVFALMQANPRYCVIIYLNRENAFNLTSMVKLINSSKFAKLVIT